MKVKLYVCIPSFNESANIVRITRLVDDGLQMVLERFPDCEPTIFNIDSASTDGTSDLFDNVVTKFPKRSIRLSLKGKGRNLIEFMRRAKDDVVDVCLTIDADIVSASPLWVVQMLEPLLLKRADFVTPIYQRSRFEGSSTNHFAFPTVYAYSGIPIRQPIGGDFAFGKHFLECIQQYKLEGSILEYGIDIALVLIGLSHGLIFEQICLGRKVHSPSFHKLEFMFPQVAEAALRIISQAKIKPSHVVQQNFQSNIINGGDFNYKTEAREMLNRAIANIEKCDSVKLAWLPDTARQYVSHLDVELFVPMSSFVWLDILSAWYHVAMGKPHHDYSDMGYKLLPFFVIRAVGFWFDSEFLESNQVENIIRDQAQIFVNMLDV